MEVFVLVEKKKSIIAMIGSWLCLCLAIVMLLFACAASPLIIGVAVFGALWYFLQFRSNIEYEYSYFDGEIRFAKIMNKSRRKNLKSFTIGDVVQIAPSGDRSVYSYENDRMVKVVDYTSHKSEVPYYDMVINSEGVTYLYKLELDDKYLDAVCMKNASKVIRRQ